MWIYVFFTCLTIANGHISNRVAIKKLQNQVRELQSDQETLLDIIDVLETNFTEKIAAMQGKSSAGGSVISTKTQVIDIGENFNQRLLIMEGRIEAIKNYLMGEKKGDIQLRKQSEDVIKEMKGKVKETESVLEALKNEVTNSLNDFEGKINNVNKTANVKINANGAVLYGGIRSACTFEGGECASEDSECRDGCCQCMPGLSYDIQAQTCVGSCSTYGKTYQSVSRKIIRGFNNDTIENTNLGECKRRCIEEKTFVCRSFDYFPQWHTCYLSESVMTDVPEEAWEYNSEGYHFQRDCK